MKYLLDASAIVSLVTNLDENLVHRAGECDEGDLVTSAIAYAEVAYGSCRQRPSASEELEAFLEEVPVLPFDGKAARAYATLPFKRGSYDRLIAAHALAEGLIVVTRNEADFADVPGLTIENWTLPL